MPVCTAVSRVTEQYPAEQLTFLSDYMMIGKRRKKKKKYERRHITVGLLRVLVAISSHTNTSTNSSLRTETTLKFLFIQHHVGCALQNVFTCLLCRHELASCFYIKSLLDCICFFSQIFLPSFLATAWLVIIRSFLFTSLPLICLFLFILKNYDLPIDLIIFTFDFISLLTSQQIYGKYLLCLFVGNVLNK